MDHMEPESTPEATLHVYKINCMKNNNGIRYSHFISMSPKPCAASILCGANPWKRRSPRDRHSMCYFTQ
jgi:hypothetical protein